MEADELKRSDQTVLPWIGWEFSRPHTWQWRTSLFSSPRRRWTAGRDQKSPLRRCFKSRPPLRAGCAGSPPAASHGCKEQSRLHQGIPGERCWPPAISHEEIFERPSASSPLGGCPASCPDTYRLTHDHRHVRNWARPQIGSLDPHRNKFFEVRGNFINVSSPRCKQDALDERTLTAEAHLPLAG